MEIFDVPAREGFDPNFLRLRKRGVVDGVEVVVDVHVGDVDK